MAPTDSAFSSTRAWRSWRSTWARRLADLADHGFHRHADLVEGDHPEAPGQVHRVHRLERHPGCVSRHQHLREPVAGAPGDEQVARLAGRLDRTLHAVRRPPRRRRPGSRVRDLSGRWPIGCPSAKPQTATESPQSRSLEHLGVPRRLGAQGGGHEVAWEGRARVRRGARTRRRGRWRRPDRSADAAATVLLGDEQRGPARAPHPGASRRRS